MRSRIGKKGTVLVVVVVLAATAVAGGALAAVAAHGTGAAATSTTINVTETNYKIALSKTSAPVGTVVFVVKNNSKTAHKFGIKGTNFTTKSISGTIAAGATKSLTVTLKKGTYTVFCALHISMGMKHTFTVGTTTGTTSTAHTTTTTHTTTTNKTTTTYTWG